MKRFNWGWLGFVAVVVPGCGGRVAEERGGASTGAEGAPCASETACGSGLTCATGRCENSDASASRSKDGTIHSVDRAGPTAPTTATPTPTPTSSSGGASPPNVHGAQTPDPPAPKPPPLRPPPEGAEADAGAPAVNYVLGGVTHDGHLVAAYWTGSSEATVLIDPVTSATTFVGTMGDLYWWQDQIVYDDSRRVAYAIGQDSAYARHVYSLSLDNGSSTSAPLPGGDGNGEYILSGITSSGRLVAAHWTGSAEDTVLLDPSTGASTFAGNLGDLYQWQNQAIYDDKAGLLYAIGQDLYGTSRLYTLSLATQESTSTILPDVDGNRVDYVFGGLTSAGRIVAARWTGSAEATVVLDPPTSTATFAGNLGDLYMWQNQLVYGGAAGVAYALGQDRAGSTHFYALTIGE